MREGEAVEYLPGGDELLHKNCETCGGTVDLLVQGGCIVWAGRATCSCQLPKSPIVVFKVITPEQAQRDRERQQRKGKP